MNNQRIFLLISFFLLPVISLAQEDPVFFDKEIAAGDYRVQLNANSSGFFTGSIQIFDKYNNTVFFADSFYTGYNSDTLIDLNDDGNRELVLDLGTGATMYDYNMFLIFDFKNEPIIPLEVHNAEFGYLDEIPKITSFIRMSPAVMGAGYVYSLRYDNGKLLLEDNVSTSKVLKSLQPNDSDDVYFVNEYEKGYDECEETSQVLVYYEANLLQWKIVGEEDNGWKFFDSYYKCKNKKKVRIELKKTIDEIYSYLKNPDNYKFGL